MPLQPAMLIVGVSLAMAVAPLAGVALATRKMPLSRVVMLLLSGTACLCVAFAAVQIAIAGVVDVSTLAVAHVALAMVILAFAALGTWCGARFADPLDAAASAIGITVVAAVGVLAAGPLLDRLPTAALGMALLANPLVAVASAAGVDLFRTPALYQLSPVAHTQVDYPAAFSACVAYGIAALTLFTDTARTRARAAAGLSRKDVRMNGSVVGGAAILLALVVSGTAGAQNAAPRAGASPSLSPDLRQKLTESVRRGAEYLRQQQKPDGTWENHPGITAMAATALLRQPGTTPGAQMPVVGRTLNALAKLAKPDGGIYDKQIPHYITAVSVMAFAAGGRAQDKPLVDKGRRYLAEHLLDEGEGVPQSDKFYGGLGYGGTSDGGRADIISLEYGLRAMKEGGTAASDPAWQKAIKFLQRTQNNSETNDQTWATNDGGFIYYPGYSQSQGTASYGAATYAGLMSYSWANVKKSDDRVQAVMKWVRNNYTVDENPGLGQKTVYYYYMVFAKALQAVGEPVIVDAKGQRHNWRDDLARKLVGLQHPEGYWVNTDKAEMQDNKVLVTAFTMMAAEAVLQ